MKRIEVITKTSSKDCFEDVTDIVSEFIKDHKGIGLLHLFIPHTTAALVISDKVELVSKDALMLFDLNYPKHLTYAHQFPNVDAHMKSIVCGCELTIPTNDGKLLLGEYQRVFILEGDGPKNNRRIICTYQD